jgi:aspartate-semialdehyde dehydrogenase
MDANARVGVAGATSMVGSALVAALSAQRTDEWFRASLV